MLIFNILDLCTLYVILIWNLTVIFVIIYKFFLIIHPLTAYKNNVPVKNYAFNNFLRCHVITTIQ